MKRKKTKYPGIFYRDVGRIGKKGTEKVFYIVYKKDGKTKEEKAGRQYADDMTPAKASKIRGDIINGIRKTRKEIRLEKSLLKKHEDSKWTVSRLWEEYKENKPGLKGMVTDQNRFVNHIEPLFGRKEPREIIPLDVDRLRIKLLKRRSAGTVKNVLELLRRIINFGVKKQLCEGIGFTIEMPVLNNLKTEDLTPGELSRLLDAIDHDSNVQAANLMKMVLYTGMRRNELFKLEWSHIDFQNGFIKIVDPKGGQDEKIPLNDAARKLLESHEKTGSPFIFPGRGGRRRVDIHRQVNRIKERAGLPKGFRALHGLRHVYASMLASSGKVDMYTLQKLLTHKSPAMTQRYAHLRDDALREASNIAGDIISNAENVKKKVIPFKSAK